MEDDILTRGYRTFCVYMDYNERSANSIMEYGLFLNVPPTTLMINPAGMEDDAEKKAMLLLGPNAWAIFTAYKIRRFSFPRRLLVQPRKYSYGCLMVIFQIQTWWSEAVEAVDDWKWRNGIK